MEKLSHTERYSYYYPEIICTVSHRHWLLPVKDMLVLSDCATMRHILVGFVIKTHAQKRFQ